MGTCLKPAGPSQVYAIGGYDETYGILAANYVYDPTTKTWTKLADMPTARGDLMCVSLLGEIYALGGFYVSESSLTYDFDLLESESLAHVRILALRV